MKIFEIRIILMMVIAVIYYSKGNTLVNTEVLMFTGFRPLRW